MNVIEPITGFIGRLLKQKSSLPLSSLRYLTLIGLQILYMAFVKTVRSGPVNVRFRPVRYITILIQKLISVRNIDLPQKVQRKTHTKRSRKHKRLLGLSIEQHSEAINKRVTFGHWEIDTVLGTLSDGHALLTLVERMTRYPIIIPLERKTADCVEKAWAYLKINGEKLFALFLRVSPPAMALNSQAILFC